VCDTGQFVCLLFLGLCRVLQALGKAVDSGSEQSSQTQTWKIDHQHGSSRRA
jgi:hypothetical protein